MLSYQYNDEEISAKVHVVWLEKDFEIEGIVKKILSCFTSIKKNKSK